MKLSQTWIGILLLFFTSAYADLPGRAIALQNPMLPSCQNNYYTYVDHQLQLNNNGQPGQYYFLLTNTSQAVVLLNRQFKTPGASAGWATQLSPGKTTILALNIPRFNLSCTAYRPPRIANVDCQSVLNVCTYPVQKNIVGSYWLAENIEANQALDKFAQRNIKLMNE